MKNLLIKILKGLGFGGLAIGGVGFYAIISILQIIFVWGTGLSFVLWGIALLLQGSIIGGLFVLFIGTPIAVTIASLLFPLWVIFLICLLIYWVILLIL